MNRDELARLSEAMFVGRVRPLLHPNDEVKFVAIDVESGAFEVDTDDHAAVSRLHGRVPGAQVWLVRAGYPTARRLRRSS